MMKKTALSLLLLMSMLAAWVQPAFAQGVPDGSPSGRWYLGLSGGPSFGQATFRSITENTTNVGVQGGIFGGYRFSRLFSVEALATMGSQKQTSLECDPFWLAADGDFSFAPILGKQGHYYRDLEAKTQWMRFGLQANFDVLSLITEPTCKWSLNLSPQVSAVTTRTKHVATGYENEFDRQWHLGLGGQASVGYRVTKCIGLQLYGGLTCLTGDRFDDIPKYEHKSNLLYEAGLKVAVHFNPSPRPLPREGRQEVTPVVEEPEPQPVVEQPVVEQTPVVEEKPMVEQPVVEQPVAEQPIVEQPVVEQPVVAEKTDVAPSGAEWGVGVLYFAHNSRRLTQKEADKLDAVAELLKAQPDVTLSIVGHASNSGSKAYNDRLSRRRAGTVKVLLVRRGIDGSRLIPVVGRGIDYEAPTGRDARRVELIMNEKNK